VKYNLAMYILIGSVQKYLLYKGKKIMIQWSNIIFTLSFLIYFDWLSVVIQALKISKWDKLNINSIIFRTLTNTFTLSYQFWDNPDIIFYPSNQIGSKFVGGKWSQKFLKGTNLKQLLDFSGYFWDDFSMIKIESFQI
jgi:hypothetical protein